MPLFAVIDTSVLREASKRVKEIDPEIRKSFIKDLKTDLRPYASAIASDVPALGKPGAMRGLGHNGRIRWGKIASSVHVTPGGGRGSLARIEIFGRGEAKAGFKMADLAGTKNDYRNGKLSKDRRYTINGQGEGMVSRLNDFGSLSAGGKAGRFVWAGFMKHRPGFLDQAVKRLDQYADRISRRRF